MIHERGVCFLRLGLHTFDIGLKIDGGNNQKQYALYTETIQVCWLRLALK